MERFGRPAKIGDIAIVIFDDECAGKNIGKTVDVKALCTCAPATDYKCTALEPMYQLLGQMPTPPGSDREMFLIRHCAAGDKICLQKRYLIVKEDPDQLVEEVKDIKPLETV